MTATLSVHAGNSDDHGERAQAHEDPRESAGAIGVAKAHRGYRHEALIYRGLDGLIDAVVPFVLDALALGQPVFLALTPARLEWVTTALGDRSDQIQTGLIEVADITALAANPARLIPALQDFLDRRSRDDQPVRMVVEPTWGGRRAAEIQESQFHDALLNLAISPDVPLWLLCPFDADTLEPAGIEEASRSHPTIVEAAGYRGSTSYGGAYHVSAFFGTPLPVPVGPVRNLVVSGDDGHQVADWVRRWAEGSGLSVQRSGRLAAAVRAIAAASVRPGRSEVLQMWQQGCALICQLRDSGRVHDPLIGCRPAGQDNSRGHAVKLANDLCDLVQVRSGPDGTTVRVHSWL